MDKSQGHRGGQRQARIRTPVCLQSPCLLPALSVWAEGRKFHRRGSKEQKLAGGSAGSPTCASRSSPFQQQLEAVSLVVESSPVQSAVSVSSLGVQVTSGGGGSGRKEGGGQGGTDRGRGQREKKREGEGLWRRERNGEGVEEDEEAGRWAGRFSPILDDEVHQGQGGGAGDSDGQVQGELSRHLSTRPHL